MSYQPSLQRLVASGVIALALLGSGLALLALAHDPSSGAASKSPPTTQGLADRSAVAGSVQPSSGTYELPPSQPHEFTLTTDGQ